MHTHDIVQCMHGSLKHRLFVLFCLFMHTDRVLPSLPLPFRLIIHDLKLTSTKLLTVLTANTTCTHMRVGHTHTHTHTVNTHSTILLLFIMPQSACVCGAGGEGERWRGRKRERGREICVGGGGEAGWGMGIILFITTKVLSISSL